MIRIAFADIMPEEGVSRRDRETAAVRECLATLGIIDEIEHTEDGAPYFKKNRDLRISVSHSRLTAVVAVGEEKDGAFGIDIEEAGRNQLAKVASRFLSEDELAVAVKVENGLAKAWTAKEAIFKAISCRNVDFRRDIELVEDFTEGLFKVKNGRFELGYENLDRNQIFCIASQCNNKPTVALYYSRNMHRCQLTEEMKESKPRLVFATNNAHKLDEIRRIVGDDFDILSLTEVGCHEDIPENEPTLEGNARAKARWINNRYGVDCFADDTGLEVEALGGAPGVHSARYAPGTSHDSEANMKYLLKNLEGSDNRKARFRTVICLIIKGEEKMFEGKVEGTIASAPEGENGFGYDPIFVPTGDIRSFAEYDAAEKNSISHRGRATRKLLDYLAEYKTKQN